MKVTACIKVTAVETDTMGEGDRFPPNDPNTHMPLAFISVKDEAIVVLLNEDIFGHLLAYQ